MTRGKGRECAGLPAEPSGVAVPADAVHPARDRARARSRVGAGLIFAVAALGIIPTAALMGLATEELAAQSGPGIGGLLNVTFGNAPELIIALFALGEGLQEVVKASIVGSIIGNILLVLGRLDVGRRARSRPAEVQPAGGQRPGDDAVPRCRRAGDAGDLRAGRGPGPAVAERRDRRLRLDGRAPVAGGGDRPDRAPTSPACSSRCARTRTSSTRPTRRRTRRATAGACGAPC